MSKAAISLTLDLHCKGIAGLFSLFHIVDLFEDIVSVIGMPIKWMTSTTMSSGRNESAFHSPMVHRNNDFPTVYATISLARCPFMPVFCMHIMIRNKHVIHRFLPSSSKLVVD